MGSNYISPRGSIYTTMMELGPKKHKKDGLLGPYSIRVVFIYIYMYVCMDVLGLRFHQG